MSYFVTGGTGFIGRYVLERLLQRKGTIYVLVRPKSRARLDAIVERLGAAKGRIVPLTGDLTEPNLGLSTAEREKIADVDHVIHLGAIYDLTASDQANRENNVGGTTNAVLLANQLDHATFHHISSIAVAGRYNGLFSENMFEAGQKLEFPYDRTKFEAEQVVREECAGPWRVYRPGIVVGDSKTGAIDKIDGPYLLFNLLKQLKSVVPAWLPTPGIVGGRANMVPVDYVAAAIDHLAHKPGLDGRAFHLVDPYPPTIGEAVSIFARAAGGPTFSLRTSNQLVQALPRILLRMSDATPPTKKIANEVLSQIGLPRQAIAYLDNPTRFGCTETLRELDGSGLAVPPLERYAKTLWDYWERNFNVDATARRKLKQAVRGRVVVITGASSGIGEVVAHRVARAGGIVILVARSREKLEVIRDEIIDVGCEADVFTADISNIDDCERVIKEIIAKHGQIDILVNNAGRSIRRSAASSYDRFHDFERTMQLNYFGALKLILGVLPGMRERKYGHIINVSSIGAQTFPPRFSAYVASKTALDAFSRCIQPEVIGDGVRLTTIYMPLVKTPMTEPTTIYKTFPMITPREASDLVIKGMIGAPRRVTTPLGNVGEVVHAVAPSVADHILATAYRLFPESAASLGADGRREKITPEAIAFAHVMRGVYW
ncbi:MAG: SDR family oxidoreductase [Thermoleophilia bacterium]|nr:SDR family oxidoreductase [Thermoleophilia bacterium]